MVEEVIGAASKLVADGAISAAVLILLALSGGLCYALRTLYLAKESQAQEHVQQMMQATALMTTLVEQLKTFSERQQEITSLVNIAGQNAAKNHETLVKIETMLEQDLRRR